MNKKAFTLAEILGVIVVIGLLLLIIAPTIINRVNSKKENVEEAANKIIYDAASQYITENREHFPQGKKYCIKLTDLIEAGKLASPVKDVKTGKDMDNDYVVEVSLYSSGDSYYELRENPDCDSNLPMIDFEVDPSNKIWAREKNVIILYPEGGSDPTYKKDNDGFIGYSQPIVFNKNGILEAQMKYKGTVIRSKINIVKIDSTPPTCNGQTGGKTNWTKDQKVTVGVKCKDNESRCEKDKYEINISGHGKTEKKTITIKDKVGNTSICEYTYNKYIDTVAPSCNGQFGGKTNWTKNQNVTVGVYCKDNDSGCGQNTFTSTISGNGKTGQKTITIKDKVGNTRNCEYTYNKYIDTTPPYVIDVNSTCQIYDNNPGLSINITVKDDLSGIVYKKIISEDDDGSVGKYDETFENYNTIYEYPGTSSQYGNLRVTYLEVRDRVGNVYYYPNKIVAKREGDSCRILQK